MPPKGLMPSEKSPRLTRRLLRALGTALMVPVILFEEWGWQPLARLMARLGRLPVIRQLEARIARSSPTVAVLLFLVPAIALLPFKFGALWLIAQGQKTLGILLILLAKLLSTALLGRLFVLTETQLMSIAWFARAIVWWRSTRERVMGWLRSSAAWRGAKALSLWLRRRLRRW